MTTKKKTTKKKRRKGLPAPESVVEEKVFLSAAGKPYRILRTTEVDEYEEPPNKK
ncbi:MAG TPA: hypothetical protein VEK79_06875 [Thermoanaerobaculia bacterium]|nr:hypothetical protein [Thermoanaerobaculia bacterium]